MMSLVACMSCFCAGLADFWRGASSGLGTVGFRGVEGPSRNAVAAEVASAMGVS